MEDAVVCKDLVKEYRSSHKTVRALDGLSLSVREGEVFGLVGPNGAGKTTLIKILATLLNMDQGSASVRGLDVRRDEGRIRAIIGYAGQDSERSAYFRLTAEENLVYFASAMRNMPPAIVRPRIRELAKVFGFEDKLNRQFVTLSGGEKQTVIVMRALLHSPKVCFLDEPSKSLDPITAKKVRIYLREYARRNGDTVLVTTHNMTEAQELSDRLALVHHGKVLFLGTPLEFGNAVQQREVIEITADRLPTLVLETLRTLEGVTRLDEGPPIQLYCQDAYTVLPAVTSTLKTAGLKLPVGMAMPSLDRSFIELVEAAR